MVTLTWNACKYTVSELHQMYIRRCTSAGVSVPCTYVHARCVTIGDSGLYCNVVVVLHILSAN